MGLKRNNDGMVMTGGTTVGRVEDGARTYMKMYGLRIDEESCNRTDIVDHTDALPQWVHTGRGGRRDAIVVSMECPNLPCASVMIEQRLFRLSRKRRFAAFAQN